MVPGLFGVDIMRELDRLSERRCELVVPKAVLRELKRISEQGKPKERAAAKVGLSLAERGEVVEGEDGADEVILKLASEGQIAVGTTDSVLRRKLRDRGVAVIYLRQKSHLAVNGNI